MAGSLTGWINRIVMILVIASTTTVILETESTLAQRFVDFFFYANLFFATIFTAEYVWRLYEARSLKYIFTPLAIIDLIALIPFYLVSFSDGFILRIFRLFRLLSLAKLGRYSSAFNEIASALWNRRYEVSMSFGIAFFAIIMASTMMFLIEGETNPENFGSIPRAMWWGMATLTTIGYGDVYPITTTGKIFTTFYALTAIGLVGMVGGIMAGAFMEVFQRRVDEDGEFPTDEDYIRYERAFNEGKKASLNDGSILDNPHEKDELGIGVSPHKGYIDGFRYASAKLRRSG